MFASIREVVQRWRKKSNKKDPYLETIILDHRSSEIQEKLKLTHDEIIHTFFAAFRQIDTEKRDFVSIHAFFDGLVEEELTSLGIMVFELFLSDIEKIEYGDLFYTIGSFCLFEVSEISRGNGRFVHR